MLDQLRRFIEIAKEDGVKTAIYETKIHIFYLLHEFKKPILMFACCDIRQNLNDSITFPHPVGIVIGKGAEIGNDVKIYQNVTIGVKTSGGEQPQIKNGVTIGAGAVILGDITIGQGAVVGANSVVNRDVPPNTVVAGSPATIVD